MSETTQEIRDKAQREQIFYDDLVVEQPFGRKLLDKFSAAFYDKGRFGTWAPVWKNVNLKGAEVLDYCCGDGHFSHRLAGLGANVTGIDISPELIHQAEMHRNELSSAQAKFIVGNALELPFPAGTFDYVFGNGCLHHLDLELAYAEIARVLKPGGRAFFMEPLFNHPALMALRQLTPRLRSPHERPLSLQQIDAAGKYFSRVRHDEHYLFAVMASPAHIFGVNFAGYTIRAIDVFDRLVMKVCPPLRGYAWLTTIQMEK